LRDRFQPALNAISLDGVAADSDCAGSDIRPTAANTETSSIIVPVPVTTTTTSAYEPAALPLQPLSWYPTAAAAATAAAATATAAPIAWQFNLSRHKLRRLAKAPAEVDEFHAFLILHNDLGNITRQEAVSMVPPLFLDVQGHHWVLDMCAAPGSKTTQMIEMLHANANANVNANANAPHLPTGVVVANDADPKRCHTLITQIKRLSSHATMVTNHEAQQFPGLRSASGALAFDRILCDVPCSGDGTVRKSPEVWQRWSPHYAGSLHPIQTRILERAIQLLRRSPPAPAPGTPTSEARLPRIVYSTCSLNPIEDEAVIAQVLRHHGDLVELVDVSALYPDLIRCPGLQHWEVMDNAGRWYQSYDQVPLDMRKHIKPSFFPPPQPSPSDTAAAVPLHLQLQRCMRFLPHHQNRGGFFVAVLQLKASAVEQQHQQPSSPPAAASTPTPEQNGGEPQQPGPASMLQQSKLKGGGGASTVEVFTEVPEADQEALHKQLRDFFGLLPAFPLDQLVASSTQLTKLYIVTPAARDILRVEARATQRLKLRHAGLRMFEKVTSGAVDAAQGGLGSVCAYRPCQEAAWLLANPAYTDGRRVVRVPRADLLLLLDQHDPYITKFTAPTQTLLTAMDVGGCVFVYDLADRPDTDQQQQQQQQPDADAGRVACVGWKTSTTAHLLLKKNDKMLLRKLLLQ
jgi:16S rRNA C967 or C1407 C5-methylase (RsmB/RsmF family)